jgi:predicted nucleic acid-binding protein
VTGVVVDASVVLAWGFPDEESTYADAVLDLLEDQPLVVPELWAVEVSNALLVGLRRGRMRPAQAQRFLDLITALPVVVDHQEIAGVLYRLLPLGSEHGLSAYDAAYLDLAIRKGLPLATLDLALRQAATNVGLPVLGGSRGE